MYLILAILCSVIVSVFLKVAKKNRINIEQAIAFNYIIAAAMCVYFLQPSMPNDIKQLSWPIFLSLGVLLPSIFIIMAKAVQYAGIVKSDAAQRLSLFLPIIAAFTLFGEQLSTSKLIGIIMAFVALLFLLYKSNYQSTNNSLKGVFLLLGVWFGYGVIDILFKQVAKMGTQFPTSLLISFILAGVLIFIYLLIKNTKWDFPSMCSGLVLGVLNFGNILFYIKAHQAYAQNPTLVFAGMNLGVIILATILGTVYFKEKLNTFNIIGIVLALSSITVLFYWTNIISIFS